MAAAAAAAARMHQHQHMQPGAFIHPHAAAMAGPENMDQFYPHHHHPQQIDPRLAAHLMTPVMTPAGEMFVPPQFFGVPQFFPGFRPFRLVVVTIEFRTWF